MAVRNNQSVLEEIELFDNNLAEGVEVWTTVVIHRIGMHVMLYVTVENLAGRQCSFGGSLGRMVQWERV